MTALRVMTDGPIATIEVDVDVTPLPCPFCGQQPNVRELVRGRVDDQPWWYVECIKPRHEACPAFAYTGGPTLPEAIRRWNTRAGGDQARIAELEAMLVSLEVHVAATSVAMYTPEQIAAFRATMAAKS